MCVYIYIYIYIHIYIYIYIYIYILINIYIYIIYILYTMYILILQPGNQDLETFLAPSADKESRNYDTHIYTYIIYI